MVALPVTARTTEQSSAIMDHPRSNRASTPTRPANSRNSTPSISPLSNASRSRSEMPHVKSNPTPPEEAGTGIEERDNGGRDLPEADEQDDDRSSSLSDFEGSLEDPDKADITHRSSPPRDPENDSEAETERLNATPQKPWNSGEVVNNTGRTPSKLREEATWDDDLSEPVSEAEDAPASPSAQRSATGQLQELAGRKRKRTTPLSDRDSPLSDGPDLEEPPSRKRPNGTSHDAEDATATVEHDEKMDDAAVDEEAVAEDEEQEETQETSSAGPSKEVKSKRAPKGKRQKELGVKQSLEREESAVDEADDAQDVDENDLSTSAKSDEDMERRSAAFKQFVAIAEDFKAFTRKLHSERLTAVEAELASLNSSSPSHPDFLAMLQTITTRRDTKIAQEYRLHHYKLQALRNKTIAERSQLHSQYFQEARDIREEILYELGEQWYKIQKERRHLQADEGDRYMFKFPAKRSDQVRQQAKYNQEVSILSGVAKYLGFPAAPEINGARENELDDDLKAMKIARRPQSVPQPTQYNHQAPTPALPAITSVRTAEAAFLEQTPWANPQHPYHRQSQTPASFAPAHLSSQPYQHQPGSLFLRQVSAQAQGQRTSSPFSTPLHVQKRFPEQPNGMGSSDTIGIPSDPPSSVQAAPPTSNRIELIPYDRTADASPTDILKRAPAAIGNPNAGADGKRNFSGLSSASTVDAPYDGADENKPQPYSVLGGGPPSLPTENSAPGQPFLTSAFHAQHGHGDEARRPEIYENQSVGFRAAIGAFGTPAPR